MINFDENFDEFSEKGTSIFLLSVVV